MSLRLRPYKHCDASRIVTWFQDEEIFRKWCLDAFPHFPITADELNAYYDGKKYCDDFFVMAAYDESGLVGQIMMRFLDEEKENLRFGFVIVDGSKRGKGYGRQLMELALQYAEVILKVKRVTIGVFDNNPSAMHLYFHLGFTEVPDGATTYQYGEDTWRYLELERKVEFCYDTRLLLEGEDLDEDMDRQARGLQG